MLDKEKRISHTHTHTHSQKFNDIIFTRSRETESPHATDDQMGAVLREWVQPSSGKLRKQGPVDKCLLWGQVEYTNRSCKGITLVLWMSLGLSHRKVNGIICSNSKPYHTGAYRSLFVGLLKQPENKVTFAVQVNIPLIQSQKQRRQKWD